jgi:cytochrome bd-type quinol oxidase subunit 2
MDDLADAAQRAKNDDLADAAIKTYRYLRIALIVLVAALAASVVLERIHATHLQESISAYYYTPTHSIFVATFVGMGVCLIVLKGSNDTEDVLLNIAGILAPIVALVPTTEPSNIYGSNALSITKARILIGNNVVALLIAGVVAIVVAYWVERSKRQGPTVSQIRMPDKVGLAVAAALIVIGGLTYWKRRQFFLDHAHTSSAIAMAAILALVVVLNAQRAHARHKRGYRFRYGLAVGIMALGIVPVLAHLQWDSFKPWNFMLESIEMGGFTTFWIMQTFELWDLGVDPVPVTYLLPGTKAHPKPVLPTA